MAKIKLTESEELVESIEKTGLIILVKRVKKLKNNYDKEGLKKLFKSQEVKTKSKGIKS